MAPKTQITPEWQQKWDRITTALYWLGESALILALASAVASHWLDLSPWWIASGAGVGIAGCIAWFVACHHQFCRMQASIDGLREARNRLIDGTDEPQ